MDDKIKVAIKIIRDNNYIIIKMTKQIDKDADECANCIGGDKDCCGCSCNICVI